jgi:hypothetical protein
VLEYFDTILSDGDSPAVGNNPKISHAVGTNARCVLIEYLPRNITGFVLSYRSSLVNLIQRRIAGRIHEVEIDMTCAIRKRDMNDWRLGGR